MAPRWYLLPRYIVYRNGVIEYGIFDTGDIYVDDLVVVIKEDGSKDIKYNAL